MRALIDIDGVLAEFTYPFLRVAKELGIVRWAHGTAEQSSWAFDFRVAPVWDTIDWTYNWWMTLPPLVSEDEVAQLNRLSKITGVYYITNRHSTAGLSAEEQSYHWLRSIGIDVVSWQVIATKDKAATAADLDIDVALDDKVENLQALKNAGVAAVARRWKYNREWSPAVGSLAEFMEGYLL